MDQLFVIFRQGVLAEPMHLIEKLHQALPNVAIQYSFNTLAEEVLIPFCKKNPTLKTIVLTIGGDGTFVTGARVAKHLKTAYVVGVHAGTLGFLATWSVKNIPEVVELMTKVHACENLELDYYVSPRHLVSYWGKVGDSQATLKHAVNEFVITPPLSDTMLTYTLKIGASTYDTFRAVGADGLADAGTHKANGLIIASATGSTAYSLAEKGVLIDPDSSRCLQIAPIAAASWNSRPIVVTDKGEDKVKVVIGVKGSPAHPILVKGDNLIIDEITDEQELVFGVSLTPINVLQPKGQTWYATLTEKLHWNIPKAHIWGVIDD